MLALLRHNPPFKKILCLKLGRGDHFEEVEVERFVFRRRKPFTRRFIAEEATACACRCGDDLA